MSRPDGVSCSRCVFFTASNDPLLKGLCRRHPSPGGFTTEEEWCGEWKSERGDDLDGLIDEENLQRLLEARRRADGKREANR